MQRDIGRSFQSMRYDRLHCLQGVSEVEGREVCRPKSHTTTALTPGHRYIIAQILGAYIGCALIYAQYKVLIVECEGALKLAGKYDALQFTPSGLAGIFALYALPGSSLGRIFLNEFVTVSPSKCCPNQSMS